MEYIEKEVLYDVLKSEDKAYYKWLLKVRSGQVLQFYERYLGRE